MSRLLGVGVVTHDQQHGGRTVDFGEARRNASFQSLPSLAVAQCHACFDAGCAVAHALQKLHR